MVQEEAKISFNIGLQAQLETDFIYRGASGRGMGVLIRLGKIEASSTTIASPITVLFIDARSETY